MPPTPETNRTATTDTLRQELVAWSGCRPQQIDIVRAPYRFCPVGAHVDHQDGEVTGFALDRGLTLAWIPTDTGEIRLRSHDAPGEVRVDLTQVPDPVPGAWGNYVRGAVRALARQHSLSRGIQGIVAGEMSPGGVSTSAALGVGCLLALERANDLEVTAETNVELDRAIENDYLGLRNGILDQSVILRARRGSLFHLDCRTGAAAWHDAPSTMPAPTFLAVYSGVSESLVTTGYNQRVAECREATEQLLRASSTPIPPNPRLRDVPRGTFETHGSLLPAPLRRRATHYFGEMARVHAAINAWTAGDLNAFGSVITETGESSIHHYECGSPELIRLFDLLRSQPGTYGARFSGAGFRGYCMAMVTPSSIPTIVETVTNAYLADFPHHRPLFHTHTCQWSDGAQPPPPTKAT